MQDDDSLREALLNLHRQKPITHVLETGTNIGLGSTKFIAETLGSQNSLPHQFVTIEANHNSWRQARDNLKGFPFIQPLWGLSTSREEALRFVMTDPVLQGHHQYPDIFIDDVADPVAFYSSEIAGRLGGGLRNPLERVREIADRSRFYAGEELLATWLDQFKSFSPLVVLDSAGGVGFLEFSIVLRVMTGYPHLLLLDDICHLKHFRSYNHVHSDSRFEVVDESKDAGWLLAQYQPIAQ
jgi:hypothetical protein